MKRLLLFFSACSLWGQVIQPNILQSRDNVTATGENLDIVNTSQQAVAWRLTFWYTGFSAVTAQIDCAPDNGSGAAGTYAACAGAFDGTSNPQAIAATPQAGTIAVKTFSPHVAVNITSATGSGTIHYRLVGYVGTNVSPSTVTASGGGGGPTTIALPCTSHKEVTLTGTGYNTLLAGSGTKIISICNIGIASASGGTPNTNTFSLAFGTCAGSPTEAANLPGVTGWTDQFFGTMAGTAGQAACFSEAVGNGDIVWFTYVQQ